MTLTSVELFAGAGGMALGLHRAGFRAVALVEQDADACATLRAVVEDGRLCGEVIEGDASAVDLSPFVGADLVAGGPPCQPFSAAGKGEGADDARDGWPAFVRAVEIVRPRFLLAENVRGFLFEKFAPYRLHVQRQLEALGYSLRVGLLNAADFGVPQTRQRVFILGARDGEAPPWPVRTHHDPKLGASLFGTTAPWVSAGEAVGLGLEVGANRGREGGARMEWSGPSTPALAVRTAGGGSSVQFARLETLGGNPSRRDMRGEGVRWGESAAPGGHAWKAGAADTVKGSGWSHQCRLSLDGEPFRAPWQWRAAWQAFPVEVRGPGVVEVLWPFAGNRGAVDRQIGNAAPPRLVEALAGELR